MFQIKTNALVAEQYIPAVAGDEMTEIARVPGLIDWLAGDRYYGAGPVRDLVSAQKWDRAGGGSPYFASATTATFGNHRTIVSVAGSNFMAPVYLPEATRSFTFFLLFEFHTAPPNNAALTCTDYRTAAGALALGFLLSTSAAGFLFYNNWQFDSTAGAYASPPVTGTPYLFAWTFDNDTKTNKVYRNHTSNLVLTKVSTQNSPSGQRHRAFLGSNSIGSISSPARWAHRITFGRVLTLDEIDFVMDEMQAGAGLSL